MNHLCSCRTRRVGFYLPEHEHVLPWMVSSRWLFLEVLCSVLCVCVQWVLSVDLLANEQADANVVLSSTESWEGQGIEV